MNLLAERIALFSVPAHLVAYAVNHRTYFCASVAAGDKLSIRSLEIIDIEYSALVKINAFAVIFNSAIPNPAFPPS